MVMVKRMKGYENEVANIFYVPVAASPHDLLKGLLVFFFFFN